MSSLSPSPVADCFYGIQWDPLTKLRLTAPEKVLLRSAETNPIDYTLSHPRGSAAYAKVVLKVLAEASGPSGPSSKVSHLSAPLPEEEALQMLYADPMGVAIHYAISRLCDIVVCLKEKKRGSKVCLGSTFFNREGNLIDEWRPLLRVLHLGGSGDAFAQRGAAYCLAFILMAGVPSATDRSKAINHASVEEPLTALVSWITSQLQASGSSQLTLLTPTLTALMSCPEARVRFAATGGVGYLARHLRHGTRGAKSGASVQQLYELCFCVWALTYECGADAAVRAAFARDGAVPALVDLVASAPREKVVRVALSALRSLAQCGDAPGGPPRATPGRKGATGAAFLGEMIGCGLMKYVDQMQERQWTDPDFVEDLDVLHKLLHDNFREMSRWDVYLAEVQSGSLEWGFLHTEKFFKEHAMQFEGPDGNFFVVKLLVALTASNDEEVQSIACYDIGEFVRHYPNGRAIARSLGAKDIVMKLVDHRNKEVQRHALTAVSKMMVQNWAAVH